MKKVEIYTWSFCPFCVEAKNILREKDISFEEIIIDGNTKTLKRLKKKTACATVPQIFVDDVFVGGCDDLKALIKESNFNKTFK